MKNIAKFVIPVVVTQLFAKYGIFFGLHFIAFYSLLYVFVVSAMPYSEIVR